MKYLLGGDASEYQTDSAKNPTRFFSAEEAKKKGIKFMFLRGAYGLRKDRAVDHFVEDFNKNGIPIGIYHYVLNSISYRDQVDFFDSLLRDLEFQIPPIVDIESEGVALSFARAYTGRLCEKQGIESMIIYSRGSFWNLFSGVESATWALKHTPWTAHYKKLSTPIRGVSQELINAIYDPELNYPVLMKPWGYTTFLQFTESGDGEYFGGNYDPRYENKVGLDLNLFMGDQDEFNSMFGLSEDPGDPGDPPIEIKSKVEVIAKKADGSPGWLYFRTRPELYGGCQLAIGYGDQLDLVENDKIQGDIEYWKVKTNDGREGYISAGVKYTKPVLS